MRTPAAPGEAPDHEPPTDGRHLRVLVIGATGYVGGRLTPRLLAEGHRVRCLVRRPPKLVARVWHERVEVHEGDVTDAASLAGAFEGVDVVYHLVHSMGGGEDFAEVDRRGARNVAVAAADAGVRQIVYLGGLGDDDDPAGAAAALSPHLASRHEVGRILAEGPVPVTELRAAVIIGSGSASFEMLRSLVEVLPAMITPAWVRRSRCQPIAIADVLDDLVGVAGLDAAMGEVLDIGGTDVVTYQQMMMTFAEVAELNRRVVVPVPFISPRLSTHWVNVVTPLPIGLARELVSSLVNDVVVRDEHSIDRVLPRRRMSFRHAIADALARVEDREASTSWSDASLASRPAEPWNYDPSWAGATVYDDVRVRTTTASPERTFRTIEGVGGRRSWYVADPLWKLRGLIDKLVGGVGLTRGRRDPDELRVGDALDFWRVEELDEPKRLRLRAEMRLPGRAWLEWRLRPLPDGGAEVTQRAIYHPKGLAGRAYWWVLWPFHGVIFPRMLRRLVGEAEQKAAAAASNGGRDRSSAAAG